MMCIKNKSGKTKTDTVDVEARKILSDKIHDLVEGKKSSGEFDDDMWNWAFENTNDEAIFQIVYHLWLCYDEYDYHNAAAMKSQSQEQKMLYQRIFLFLKTNLLYQTRFFSRAHWKNLFYRCTFQFSKIYRFEYWPFVSAEDYQTALRNTENP